MVQMPILKSTSQLGFSTAFHYVTKYALIITTVQYNSFVRYFIHVMWNIHTITDSPAQYTSMGKTTPFNIETYFIGAAPQWTYKSCVFFWILLAGQVHPGGVPHSFWSSAEESWPSPHTWGHLWGQRPERCSPSWKLRSRSWRSRSWCRVFWVLLCPWHCGNKDDSLHCTYWHQQDHPIKFNYGSLSDTWTWPRELGTWCHCGKAVVKKLFDWTGPLRPLLPDRPQVLARS